MPSSFLKQRHRTLFSEVAGTGTIDYYRYTPVSADDLTREVDEGSSFGQPVISIGALVDFAPSRATREKVGTEIAFDATVRLCRAICDDLEIRPRVGDEVTLPLESARYRVIQVIKEKQSGSDFLEYLLAVVRRVGRNGK
jgi:hypothetical protein